MRQLHSEVPEMTSDGSDYVWHSRMVLKHGNAMFQSNRSLQVTAVASWLCADDNGMRYVPLSYSSVCLVVPCCALFIHLIVVTQPESLASIHFLFVTIS